MKKKVALITGITGQDGSYLLEFLLKKKYIVHGIKRRTSLITTDRIDRYYKDPEFRKDVFIHYSDLLDTSSLFNLIKEIKPDEIYHLAAQSHVGVSFLLPQYTSQVNSIGTLNILEIIKSLKSKKIKLYNASSSEMFGDNKLSHQNEKTPFEPCSPYAISKVFAHNFVKHYRETFHIFACNGILFNHESPRRGDFFVTKKIIKGLIKIKYKKSKILYLGNLDAKRDWGHAKEYVKMMWKMLQQKKPDDFVISTGKQISVKEFVKLSAKKIGFDIQFKGKGLNTIGIDKNTNRVIVKCRKNYFRPHDVNNLRGDSSKAKKILKWKPKISLSKLIDEMIFDQEKFFKR